MLFARTVAHLLLALSLALTAGCLDGGSPNADPGDSAGADATDGPAGDAAGGGSDATSGLDQPVGQILFGDLHVHSTYSIDAALLNTPILGGRGLAGPALRCDYARFCSQLDFWSINDHPEGMPPALWDDTKDAIRTCNDLEGGDTDDPSMVTYLGWEWTQSATSAASDFGHKNVVLLDTADADVPTRPIAAPSQIADSINGNLLAMAVALAANVDPDNTPLYDELGAQLVEGQDAPLCETGVDTRTLPLDCQEIAVDPAELYEKLDQWGAPALVIPHGTTWGAHNPPLGSWSYQLTPQQHHPGYERLVEVYSGHGSMEPWRPWTHATENTDDGTLSCPLPVDGFEACCWRAGEIIRGRSEVCAANPAAKDCEAEVAAAQLAYLEAGAAGVDSVGESTPSEWGECGQCTDCFQPAFLHRPGLSTQAALADTWFGDDGETLGYHWGFIGSTDSHKAGPGAGYKEVVHASDVTGPSAEDFQDLFELGITFVFNEWERQNAYYYSGGLVAVHSEGRDRHAIWDALQRREVYATSGERMLLWFDLVAGAEGGEPAPMGSQVTASGAPTFEVRVVGSQVQAPGCSDAAIAAAGADFIDDACLGECYNPTDERHVVTRIEVVKITPRVSPDEALAERIEDPFTVLDCEPDPEGCVRTFDDPAWDPTRPAIYYVRAIQEPTPQLNGDNLACERDAAGVCVEVNPCVAGYLADGDCLTYDEERAWSSPIYLVPVGDGG